MQIVSPCLIIHYKVILWNSNKKDMYVFLLLTQEAEINTVFILV